MSKCKPLLQKRHESSPSKTRSPKNSIKTNKQIDYEKNHFLLSSPAILKPDFDLLGLNISQNGTLSDQLLPAQRAWLRALGVNSFKSLHLL